jgi:hypothetical protein
MRSLISAGACTVLVGALAACGGGGGGSGGTSHPAAKTISGSGFSFRAPGDWHVVRRNSVVSASPSPTSTELVSVSVFPLLRTYSPSLFTAVSRELDGDARKLASRLGGAVASSTTVTVAAIRSRQYELTYTSAGHEDHQRITFVLRGKTEFQLLCRWSGSEPSACVQLEQTFRPS